MISEEHMIYNRYHIGIIILTVLSLSCNDQSHFYYPNEVGFVTGRGTTPRFESVMDSTIAGVPMVVGSEWVYADSFSLNLSYWYHDTIRIRLAAVTQNSVNDFICTYQEFSGDKTDTFYLYLQGNTLNSIGDDQLVRGGIWGNGCFYSFPLTVGRFWINPIHSTIDSSVVVRKEKITVKGGTFYTYLIRIHSNATMETSDRWYVPDIGIVRISGSSKGFADIRFDLEYRTELLSYHIGPRRR